MRALLAHPGQTKNDQEPPFGKRRWHRPTSRETPAIVTRIDFVSAVTSPPALSRDAEIEGQSSSEGRICSNLCWLSGYGR
jgi:hypothetical protein